MVRDWTVVYSFLLYVFYVCLPLIPAVLIFKMFPEAKVTLSGPLQNFTINATGAFAAYVAVVVLGFFLVRDVWTEIVSTRRYAVEGVVSDLQRTQGINSDQFYSRYTTDALTPDGLSSLDFHFVIVLDHPVLKPETVWLKFYDFSKAPPVVGVAAITKNGPKNGAAPPTVPKNSSGVGAPPAPTKVPMELWPGSAPQRFSLDFKDGTPKFVHEVGVTTNSVTQNTDIAKK